MVLLIFFWGLGLFSGDYLSFKKGILGFVFWVSFDPFYHGIHHHFAPPFGFLCFLSTTKQANLRKNLDEMKMEIVGSYDLST